MGDWNMEFSKYLNDTVYATIKVSSHGIGVFAIRDIPKGTKLTDHNPGSPADMEFIEISREEFEHILPEIQELILDRMVFSAEDETLTFLSPNHEVFIQSFMNHSEESNSNGIFADKNIKKGEEITENYRKFLRNPENPDTLTKNHMPFIWK